MSCIEYVMSNLEWTMAVQASKYCAHDKSKHGWAVEVVFEEA